MLKDKITDNKKVKRAATLFLLPLIAMNLSVQSLSGESQTPITSQLKAEVMGSKVILTWQTAPGFANIFYEIRRSNTEISLDSIEESEFIAVVPPNTETYTDSPQAGREWWYAVLPINGSKRFGFLIPNRNTLVAPVVIESETRENADFAKVLTLNANVMKLSIELEWFADRSHRDIIVLRSPAPLNDPENLKHAVKVGRSQGSTANLIDSPQPGGTWYYAAVDADLFESGNPQWFKAAAFSEPVVLHSIDSVSSPNHQDSLSFTHRKMPPRYPLSPEALSSLASILNPIQGKRWTPPIPVILDVDSGFSENPWQILLQGVLQGPFADKSWEAADTELSALSAVKDIDTALQARIQFYRGQCLYFMDDLDNAFLSFLVSSDYYHTESWAWMLRIYDDLTPVG